MTNTRIDPRVGDFIQTFLDTETALFELEPFALEAMVAIQPAVHDALKLTSLSFEDVRGVGGPHAPQLNSRAQASLADLQVQVLAEAVRGHNALKNLSLAKNRITGATPLHNNSATRPTDALRPSAADNGVKLLAAALAKNEALTSLVLSDNKIGVRDRGAICRAAALRTEAACPAGHHRWRAPRPLPSLSRRCRG